MVHGSSESESSAAVASSWQAARTGPDWAVLQVSSYNNIMYGPVCILVIKIRSNIRSLRSISNFNNIVKRHPGDVTSHPRDVKPNGMNVANIVLLPKPENKSNSKFMDSSECRVTSTADRDHGIL